jgi:hypothetical protein
MSLGSGYLSTVSLQAASASIPEQLFSCFKLDLNIDIFGLGCGNNAHPINDNEADQRCVRHFRSAKRQTNAVMQSLP